MKYLILFFSVTYVNTILTLQLGQKLLVWELSSRKHFGRETFHWLWAKRRGHWLQNWPIGSHLYFKIQMGVMGSIFEPHPSNFGYQSIFWSWKNDSTIPIIKICFSLYIHIFRVVQTIQMKLILYVSWQSRPFWAALKML